MTAPKPERTDPWKGLLNFIKLQCSSFALCFSRFFLFFFSLEWLRNTRKRRRLKSHLTEKYWKHLKTKRRSWNFKNNLEIENKNYCVSTSVSFSPYRLRHDEDTATEWTPISAYLSGSWELLYFNGCSWNFIVFRHLTTRNWKIKVSGRKVFELISHCAFRRWFQAECEDNIASCFSSRTWTLELELEEHKHSKIRSVQPYYNAWMKIGKNEKRHLIVKKKPVNCSAKFGLKR